MIIEIGINTNYEKKPLPTDQYGTAALVAIGALVHNIALCAQNDGFEKSKINFVSGDTYFSSRVILIFKERLLRSGSDLTTFLKTRKTTRGPFSTKKIDHATLQQARNILSRFNSENPNTSLIYIEWGDGKDVLIKTLLRLATIGWTNSKVRKQMTVDHPNNYFPTGPDFAGLCNRLLSLEKISRLIFLKLPFIGRPARWFLPYIFKKFNRDPLINSDRIFLLGAKNDCLEAWIHLGIAMQEIWLHFSQSHIAFQPLTQNLIAYNHLKNRNATILSRSEIQKVENIHWNYERRLGLRLDRPMIGFRVGYHSNTQSNLSSRRRLTALPLT